MSPNLNQHRASELIKQLRDRNIVVLGDVMLDEFIWGDVSRISPEAPVPVVDIRRESTHLGGAANVLANLLALGANACVIGGIGQDFAGERIRSSVREKSALQTDDLLIADDSRPTTIKTRISAHNQIRARLGCDAVRITRGEQGMMLIEGTRDPVFVETAAREVYDVTGAGDTVVATLAAALAAGASMTEAAVLANQAAGIVVRKLGTATASPQEILETIQ